MIIIFIVVAVVIDVIPNCIMIVMDHFEVSVMWQRMRKKKLSIVLLLCLLTNEKYHNDFKMPEIVH